MSKNDTLKDSISRPFEIKKDENFKDIVRYKAITALIVKSTIQEYSSLSLTEIASLIVNTKQRPANMTKEQLLGDEVDQLPTEIGTGKEKNTINDFVFNIRIPGSDEVNKVAIIDKIFSVDIEMQNSSPNYLVQRGIYYGASLLRETVPESDSEYANIHKVYSIWFCSKNIPQIKQNNAMYKGRADELNKEFVHHFGIRRFYSDIDQVSIAEKDSDLIEVVFIELNKLKEISLPDYELVKDLFFNTSTVIQDIEVKEQVTLNSVEKGVYKMIDYEARLKQHEIDYEARLKQHEIDCEAMLKQRVAETEAETEARVKVEERTESAYLVYKSIRETNPTATDSAIIAKVSKILLLSDTEKQMFTEKVKENNK